MIRLNTLFVFILLNSPLFSQISEEENLAQQYFQKGEPEKAAELYGKLFSKNPNSVGIYKSYYQTLISLKDFSKAEKLVKKQLKKFPDNSLYYVDLGNIFRMQQQADQANNMFDKAINLLSVEELQINSLANSFNEIAEYDFAIKTYLKGRKLFHEDKRYSYELAGLYEAKKDIANMIASYLDFMEDNPSQTQLVKNALQQVMDDEKSYKELQSLLYKRIQHRDDVLFSDLLIWLFVQKKDFEQAFLQVRALDKRFKENGQRVYQLASLAMVERDYDAAIRCYQYVIDLGKNNYYYLSARKELLNCKKLKIINSAEFTQTDLQNLENDYLGFLNEYGKTAGTLSVIRELANIYAFYMHNLEKAISLLEDAISSPNADKFLKANCKLDLGDYYLMSGDVWEPVLLYGQVDKEFRDGAMGEEARFRNAKLSYYKGEFEWAQAQMDVLKASTSELIANDALNLSVFIQDNLGMDSVLIPMNMFVDAELSIFQNKDEEALNILDTLSAIYPLHNLGDDILFAKAKVMQKKRKYEQADTLLGLIIKEYPADILADDALFQLAELNEKKLNNKEKAMNLYEKLITEYNGSLFVVESRKRFRKLRGDSIN